MKTMLKMFTTLLLLVASLTLIHAQDTTEISLPDFAGTLTLTLPEIAYADGVLTVNELPENASWIATSPEILGGLYNTVNFVNDWQASEAEVDAVLITGSTTAIVKLTVKDYDAVSNVVNFAVEEVKVVAYAEVKGGAKIPATFENATLSLNMTNDFALALASGFETRANSTRVVQTCPPLRTCP